MSTSEMPSWEEWSGLTEQQREYSLYKTLEAINKQLAEQEISWHQQKLSCSAHFAKLEKRKKWNSGESLFGGVIGGIMAIIGSWAFWKGTGP